MRRWVVRLVLAGSIGVLPTAAAACTPPSLGPGTETLQAATAALAFRPEPRPIRLGEPFAIELAVCMRGSATLERITVDATMPEHRHGMNYAPTVVSRGAGRWRAEGLMLHMPGRWQLAFEVRAGGAVTLLTTDVVLP